MEVRIIGGVACRWRSSQAGRLLWGHRVAGSDALAGLNWFVLAQHAELLDKTRAAGLRSHSHGLWNQGWPCPDAYVEAGCL